MRTYDMRRVEMTATEYADLAIKDPGVVYVVNGVVVSIGGLLVSPPTMGKRIAAFGDSFLRNGWRYESPWAYSQSGSITGAYVEGLEALIDGSANTLTIDAAAGTAQFDGGTVVAIRNGYQRIPGATGVYDGVHIRVNMHEIVSGSLTVTRSGTRADEVYSTDNPLVWAQIFSRQSIEFINYAASGSTLRAMAGPTGSVALDLLTLPSDVSAMYFQAGSNDVQGGRALADMQADAADIIDRLLATGRRVYVSAQPPARSEWNSDSAKRAKMATYAMWLRSYVANLPRVTFVNAWESMLAESGTSLRSAYTVDGIHQGDAAGQLGGYAIWQALGAPIEGGPVFGSADGAVSATNPYGNYLASPYLAGDTSGVATGFTKSESNATGTPTKVARTDGIAGDLQRVTFGASADGGNVQIVGGTMVSGQFPADYIRVRLFAEVFVSGGAQLCPNLGIAITTASRLRYGRSSTSVKNSVNLPMTTWSGVLATAPFLILPGDTSFNVLLQPLGANGTAAAVTDFGRLLLKAA